MSLEDTDPDAAEPVGGLDALAPVGRLSDEEMRTPSAIQGLVDEGKKRYQSGLDALEASRGRQVETVAQKRVIIQQGLDALLARKPSTVPLLLATSGAFFKPTVTGSFGETLGNVATAAAAPAANLINERKQALHDELEARLALAQTDEEREAILSKAAQAEATLGSGLLKTALSADQQRVALAERAAGSDPQVVRLQNAMDRLPPNDPRRATYKAMIDKLTAPPRPAGALSEADRGRIDQGNRAYDAAAKKVKGWAPGYPGEPPAADIAAAQRVLAKGRPTPLDGEEEAAPEPPKREVGPDQTGQNIPIPPAGLPAGTVPYGLPNADGTPRAWRTPDGKIMVPG